MLMASLRRVPWFFVLRHGRGEASGVRWETAYDELSGCGCDGAGRKGVGVTLC